MGKEIGKVYLIKSLKLEITKLEDTASRREKLAAEDRLLPKGRELYRMLAKRDRGAIERIRRLIAIL